LIEIRDSRDRSIIIATFILERRDQRMPLRTVSLALIANNDPDPTAAVRYALDLAGRTQAHLLARIGVPPLVFPTLALTPYALASQMQMIEERENVERKEQCERMAKMIRLEAERLGAIASSEVISAAYDPLSPHLIRMARVSDVCIALASQATAPLQRDMLIDMLFDSGAPLLIVPPNWDRVSPIRNAVVAWDGSACAARAVRDALPLLAEAESVEVVSVLGEKDLAPEVSGADIASHVARHCLGVSVNVLPALADGVAATLSAHAASSKSDLLVMGGYGHSRLQEFVLGGVTRDTLARTEIPTLLSH
jgi:nucleotide-binding universal stress UspA family protein